MCELFALSAKYPCHLKLSLAKFVEHATSRNQDGWGLANMDGNDAYIYREPVSAQDSFLARFLAQEGVMAIPYFLMSGTVQWVLSA